MSRKTSRLSKRELLNRLLCLFEKSENKPLHVKDIFNSVGADKHPSKMLVIECLADLVFDDFLTTDNNGTYIHQPRGSQVIEGIFHKKRNGHNVFAPDDG